MNKLVKLAAAVMLWAGASAIAADSDPLREAAEIAGGIEPTTQSMMEKIPRTCRLLRRAARDAEGTADAERIGDAMQHCRRAMEALRNGNPKHAAQRLRRMVALIDGPTPS